MMSLSQNIQGTNGDDCHGVDEANVSFQFLCVVYTCLLGMCVLYVNSHI